MYSKDIKLKHSHFREAYPKGKNFDEVRTATEGSPSGRPKGVPLGAKAGKS